LDSQAQQFKPLLDKMDLNSWCLLTQALFDQSVFYWIKAAKKQLVNFISLTINWQKSK
jgi:hypothetical protein